MPLRRWGGGAQTHPLAWIGGLNRADFKGKVLCAWGAGWSLQPPRAGEGQPRWGGGRDGGQRASPHLLLSLGVFTCLTFFSTCRKIK